MKKLIQANGVLNDDDKILVLTHVDNDGKCCGAIVRWAYPNARVMIVNYGRKVDKREWFKEPTTAVVVTDFQFDFADMEWLANHFKLIWIDHHPNSITLMDKLFGDEWFIPGKRMCYTACDKDASAAMLTWRAFNKQGIDAEAPSIVKYVSDYDNWQFKYPETMAISSGLNLVDIMPSKKTDFFWTQLLNSSSNDILERIITVGRYVLLYKKFYANKCTTTRIFETTFEGYIAAVANVHSFNSTLFDSWLDLHPNTDVLITFSWTSKHNQYRFSIYSVPKKDKPSVNVNELAMRYGGGGHPEASGFMCSMFPFEFPKPEIKESAVSVGLAMDCIDRIYADDPTYNYVKNANRHQSELIILESKSKQESFTLGENENARIIRIDYVNDDTDDPAMMYNTGFFYKYNLVAFWYFLNDGSIRTTLFDLSVPYEETILESGSERTLSPLLNEYLRIIIQNKVTCTFVEGKNSVTIYSDRPLINLLDGKEFK